MHNGGNVPDDGNSDPNNSTEDDVLNLPELYDDNALVDDATDSNDADNSNANSGDNEDAGSTTELPDNPFNANNKNKLTEDNAIEVQAPITESANYSSVFANTGNHAISLLAIASVISSASTILLSIACARRKNRS